MSEGHFYQVALLCGGRGVLDGGLKCVRFMEKYPELGLSEKRAEKTDIQIQRSQITVSGLRRQLYKMA
jgi:hypothetical protein